VPALLELQRAFGAALLGANTADAAATGASPALGIYRNTCLTTLTGALALSFPAVRRLVGAEFFEAVAYQFIGAHPPSSAYLNDYGVQFPAFVAQQRQARALHYLPDVARLEWAVNRALHAQDAAALDLSALAALDPASIAAVRFVPHGGVAVLELDTPADAIWRAVLDEDDAAMRSLDLSAGPVWLLVGRERDGVQVRRIAPVAARFSARLFAGEPLQAALDALADGTEAGAELPAVLADHLASGRLIGWQLP
jgi:hypothetical protein